MRSIYFHEDDYCQIELLPLSNWNHCLSQMQQINEFSEARKIDVGWTDIYLRPDAPQELGSLSIDLNAMKLAIGSLFQPYDAVTTGYSSYVENCPNTVAWGNTEALTIFADYDETQVIKHIWLSIGMLNSTEAKEALLMFQSLPKCAEMLLANWNWGRLISLKDEHELESYLSQEAD